jgi:coiled-coil domain-containing protein 130
MLKKRSLTLFNLSQCNNHYIIRTDPANLDYVIESGARRQENRFQASENGTVVPDDKETIKRLASDPMFKLDRGDVDVSKAKKEAHPRINKIAQIQGSVVKTNIFLVNVSNLGAGWRDEVD